MIFSNVDFETLPEMKAYFLEWGISFVVFRYLFKVSFPRGNYLNRLATSAGILG